MEENLRSTTEAFMVSVVAIIVSATLHWMLRSISKRTSTGHGREPGPNHRTPHFYSPIGVLALQTLLWLSTVLYISGLFRLTGHWRRELIGFLNMAFTADIFTLGKRGYSILSLLLLLSLITGLWLFTNGVARLIRGRILHGMEVDPSAQNAVAFLTKYGFMFVGVVVILRIWGVDFSSLAILAGIFGVGIGFGLQNIANNFISGLIILFEKPIKIGDFIKVGELVGTVKRVGLRSTEVSTTDNLSIIVPNSRFLENDVVNWSHGDPVSRIHLPLAVGYGADLQRVRTAILEAAMSHPDILHHPAPEVWMKGFGDSSIDLNLYFWITEPRKQFKVMSDLYYRVEAAMRRKGIEVPFPQRDLHLRSPQLEEAISAWTELHRPPEVRLYQPNGRRASKNRDKSITATASETHHPISPESISELEGIDINALVNQMRGPGGVEIKNRRYRMNTYEKSFVGSEAVEWLMRTQKATRDAAIQIGQLLFTQGVIHHVLDQHPFEDGYYFYRFYEDEE